MMSAVPIPWSLAVDDDVLDDLYDRVRRTRWSDSVAGRGLGAWNQHRRTSAT